MKVRRALAVTVVLALPASAQESRPASSAGEMEHKLDQAVSQIQKLTLKVFRP